MNADAILRRNNVQVRGSGGRTLLFAHGFGCSQSVWRHVASAFESSHRVVTLDYVGSGDSDPSAYDRGRYGSLEGYAQDILEVCEALGLEDAGFVGHSVSSMIGLLAALRAPGRFREMVFIGPSPCYVNDPPDYHGGFERADLEGLLDLMERNHLGWTEFLAPVVMQNPERPELAEDLRQSFCALDPVVARDFAQVTFLSDCRADVGRLSIPSLILQCSGDVVAPLPVGEFLHRHIPGSTLVHMAATGHCPHLSHPEETIARIADYLRRSG